MKNKFTFALLLVLLLCATTLYAQTADTTKTVINNGVGLGSVIAVVASWSRNRSILWAILHGIFSWLYVIYFALTRTANEQA
ncbi:hypothetical protein [uncultured Pontibacter sp.]|uniref:hypothetical protein n=1 Tax=uncultured Pontibacter sp. TaxID=453356 RepID=UPI0026108603|nr:hypothetical protein [uncultured Pontibacter sp.]